MMRLRARDAYQPLPAQSITQKVMESAADLRDH
jgi:hypothetical protein